MKKFLLFSFLFFSLNGFSQVTPSVVIRIVNSAAQFGTSLPIGGILCDISNGKTYRLLRPISSTATLAGLTKDLDYKEFLTESFLVSHPGENGAWIRLANSDGTKDSVLLYAGTNMASVVQQDDHTIVFNAAAGGGSGATYSMSAETGSVGSWIKILGSDGSKDSVKLAAGTNMASIVRTDANTITFNAGAASLAGLVDDLNFEFADIVYGIAQTYTLDIKASYGYTITSASLEVDNGTLTGIAVKINSTTVTSLSSVTADTAVDETLATGANTVVTGDRISITTSTGYTGAPTVLRGKIKITRT
jgi:hypothetical protein